MDYSLLCLDWEPVVTNNLPRDFFMVTLHWCRTSKKLSKVTSVLRPKWYRQQGPYPWNLWTIYQSHVTSLRFHLVWKSTSRPVSNLILHKNWLVTICQSPVTHYWSPVSSLILENYTSPPPSLSHKEAERSQQQNIFTTFLITLNFALNYSLHQGIKLLVSYGILHVVQ